MPGLLDVYRQYADTLAEGIKSLEAGLSANFDFQGKTYTLADRVTLHSLYDLYVYRAAREAILAGGQDITIVGRRFTRAQLGEIEKQIQRLEAGAARTERGGIRVRNAVPI